MFEEHVNTNHIEFETKEENLYYEGVMDIDPSELNRKLKGINTTFCIVDVRQSEEYRGELGHIPGAKLIVLDTLENRFEEIPKDKAIVFVCRSGSRSARAAAVLKERGYDNVFNLKGGMLLWNDLHFPTEV
jgi:rhodanese-related sulfurtransferase